MLSIKNIYLYTPTYTNQYAHSYALLRGHPFYYFARVVYSLTAYHALTFSHSSFEAAQNVIISKLTEEQKQLAAARAKLEMLHRQFSDSESSREGNCNI